MSLVQEHGRRMLEEKRLLEALAKTEKWFTPNGWSKREDGGVALDFRLTVAIELDAKLVYPAFFPETPAYILPLKRNAHWSKHQYGGDGVLCLEYGPDNWHNNVTGVDLVYSAYKLLAGEVIAAVVDDFPEAPSRHQNTLGQQLRFEKKRFIISAQMRGQLNSMPDNTRQPIRACYTLLDRVSTTIVTHFGEGDDSSINDVPMELEEFSFGLDGWAICDQRLANIPVVSTVAELRATLEGINCWPWADELKDGFKALLLVAPGIEPRLFTLSGGAQPVMWECNAVRFEREDADRLPDQLKALGQEWVAIAGLGSVGSKIAVSLARSGVRNFVLIDDDVLGPANLVRHQLTWQEVGFHKVAGVAHQLRLIAPDVKVIPKSFRLAGQENPQVAAELLPIVSLCRLVVDATANADVFVTLAAICKRAKSTLVWGELFPGGGGALMARSRAGIDADALNVRNHIAGCLEEFPPAPDKRAKSYDIMSDDAIVIAGDADVSALAASMTQFTLDSLCALEESQYPVSAYLIGYKKYWVFEQPFMTIPIDCAGAVAAQVVEAPMTPVEQAEVDSFIAIIKEAPGAASDGST